MKCPRCHGSGNLMSPEEIKAARLASGLQQLVVAKRMKILPSYYSTLEGGKNNWNADLEVRFLAVLKRSKQKPKL